MYADDRQIYELVVFTSGFLGRLASAKRENSVKKFQLAYGTVLWVVHVRAFDQEFTILIPSLLVNTRLDMWVQN